MSSSLSSPYKSHSGDADEADGRDIHQTGWARDDQGGAVDHWTSHSVYSSWQLFTFNSHIDDVHIFCHRTQTRKSLYQGMCAASGSLNWSVSCTSLLINLCLVGLSCGWQSCRTSSCALFCFCKCGAKSLKPFIPNRCQLSQHHFQWTQVQNIHLEHFPTSKGCRTASRM